MYLFYESRQPRTQDIAALTSNVHESFNQITYTRGLMLLSPIAKLASADFFALRHEATDACMPMTLTMA